MLGSEKVTVKKLGVVQARSAWVEYKPAVLNGFR